MSEFITIALPETLKEALDEIAEKEGLAADQVIGDALSEHLFLRRFRSLRARMQAKALEQGIVTDQDVFDRVS